MRRLLIACLLIAITATAAFAFLPVNIENTIRTWFDSANRVAIIFKKRAAPVLANDQCETHFDRVINGLVANCKTSSGTTTTVVLPMAAGGCIQDSTGNLLCNTVTSVDQNTLSPAAANRWHIFDNDENLTPNPTCSSYGQTGIATIFDTTEGAADTYGLCDGTTLVDNLNATIDFAVPYGFYTGGDTTAIPGGDDDCACFLFSQTAPMAGVDFITMGVSALDADDTITLGIYSEDGSQQYFEGPIVVTSVAATVKAANAHKVCVAGANEAVTCAADSECPGSTCAVRPLPRGSYFFCLGQNLVTTGLATFAANSAQNNYRATFTSTSLCTAGNLPSTLAVTKTWGSGVSPYFVLSDE